MQIMKPLIQYTDFRAYLCDWVEERKSLGLPGSNRWFAMKMGINSTSWLTSVLKGIKGLSNVTTNKLSIVLKHSPIEARFFETLVGFNQAHSIEERNSYYQQLISLRKMKNVRTVEPGQFDFYSTWYHTAVRSLIGMYEFTADKKSYERLAAMVSPPITASQVRKSTELLVKLNLIAMNSNGKFELAEAAITSGEEIQSLAVANFQQETIRLASEALDRYPRKDRYIGTATVGIGEESFSKIKALLIDTGNKIAEIANADANAQQVYQINFQAFPMTKSPVPEKKDVMEKSGKNE